MSVYGITFLLIWGLLLVSLVVFLVLSILPVLISGAVPIGCHTFGCHP